MAEEEQQQEVEGPQQFVMHLRGLPWSATEQEIMDFLELTADNVESVTIQMNDRGKPSGEGYVVCTDQEAAEKALTKHKETMPGTNRYVEIFKSSTQAMVAGGGTGGKGQWDGVIKMRGMPFGATSEDIKAFFAGLEWLEEGITIPLDGAGKCQGEAFVQFEDYSNANAALERNKQEIQGRYIELFKSNNSELRQCIIKNLKLVHGGPQSGGGMGGGMGGGNTWGGLNIGGGGGRGGRGGFGGGRPAPY